MTDAETYAAICADFPFDGPQLDALSGRLERLLDKAQNGPPQGKADGTIGRDDWYRLRALTWAMADLVRAMHVVEHGGNPMTVEVVRARTGGAYDDIPF